MCRSLARAQQNPVLRPAGHQQSLENLPQFLALLLTVGVKVRSEP